MALLNNLAASSFFYSVLYERYLTQLPFSQYASGFSGFNFIASSKHSIAYKLLKPSFQNSFFPSSICIYTS